MKSHLPSLFGAFMIALLASLTFLDTATATPWSSSGLEMETSAMEAPEPDISAQDLLRDFTTYDLAPAPQLLAPLDYELAVEYASPDREIHVMLDYMLAGPQASFASLVAEPDYTTHEYANADPLGAIRSAVGSAPGGAAPREADGMVQFSLVPLKLLLAAPVMIALLIMAWSIIDNTRRPRDLTWGNAQACAQPNWGSGGKPKKK